ncbi:MAG: branched-chain amino acid ABC transporter permease [Alphaproteobacteria bacterium]|nr:branched-chain amino acid ABC transporter permease [Alphaproteobacteria bacterium]
MSFTDLLTPVLMGQVLLDGMSISSIYILIALGFTLLFGIMRVVNFAHGEFAMLGGWGLYYLYGQFNVPFLLAVPLAGAIVAVCSLVFEQFVFRFFYQKMFQSMIGLLGLSTAMIYTAVIIWDAYERQIPPAFTSTLEFGESIFGESLLLPTDRVVVFLVSMATLAAFYFLIMHTRMGLGMRAAAQDVEVAEAMGIRTRTVYRQAFLLAIFMTAVAGALYGQIYFLSYELGSQPLLKAFIVVILGGMGSIPGAALGGVILGMSETFLATLFGAAVSNFVSFGVVILILIIRPWGLLGKPE